MSTVALVAIISLGCTVMPDLSGSRALAAGGDCSDSVCANQLEQILAGEKAASMKSRLDGSLPSEAETGITGFKISVDGKKIIDAKSKKKGSTGKSGSGKDIVLDESTLSPASPGAGNLSDVSLDVRYDGLDTERQLAVSTVGERRSVKPGQDLEFYGNWNYPAWVKRAEVRIYRRVDMPLAEQIRTDATPIKVVAMDGDLNNGSARGKWTAPTAESGKLFVNEEDRNLVYTIRVYDDEGRFDETMPLSLLVTSDAESLAANPVRDASEIPGQGKNHVAVTNIPVHGGSVTVYGRNIPAGYKVKVMGSDVPLGMDETNKGHGYKDKRQEDYISRQNDAFVMNRILPPGDHNVDVNVSAVDGSEKKSGRALTFDQDVNIPQNDFFMVGLADATFGMRTGGKDSQILTNAAPGDYNKYYKRGRIAYYLKGKMQGKYILTSALDTTEEKIDEIFSHMGDKDPRQLLRRLDPDDYYPVYGDDSTIEQDAPTSGRYYVKLEKGDSHVMWGNFKTSIDGTELARFERGLYGAQAVYKSEKTTTFGEPVAKVQGFAARPGSMAQRDEYRGTGGSSYFLRHQDINEGSEILTVEERDRVTGQIVERRQLIEGKDYRFDYIQGLVILNQPLQSTTASSSVVRDTAVGGNQLYLVAQYEYTPGLGGVDGSTFGGRGETWLTDNLKVGISGFKEGTGDTDQTLWGVDTTLRLTEKSFVDFEWAESKGNTFGLLTSTDGGYIFNSVSGDGKPNDGKSQAWRSKVSLDLQELTGTRDENGQLEGGIKGNVGGYYEKRDEGFNAPGRYTDVGERLWGVFAEVEPTEDWKVSGRYDDITEDDGRKKREGTIESGVDINDQWNVAISAQHSDVEDSRDHDRYKYDYDGTGKRTDIGMRVTQTIAEDFKVWLFGQVTVDKDDSRKRNDRGGIGIEKAITDQITASGEVSYGTSGVGALASVAYEPTADDRYYVGYRLSPEDIGSGINDGINYDPFGRDYGAIVFGANRKLDDRMSAYLENNYDIMGFQRSYTQSYGVTYTPDDVWRVTGGVETGKIFDDFEGNFDRVAFSSGLEYKESGKDAGARFEARFENGVGHERDRNTYLGSAHYGIDYSDDWRFLANIDAVYSDSDQADYLNGNYTEGSVGWAYRPVDNDRFNALFKYTYLYDLPGYDQVNSHGDRYSYAQRSHVLSADFVQDLNQYWSIGGKYAFRFGEVSRDRERNKFMKDSAHLGIIRADFHVVEKWDIVLEGRVLTLPDINQTHYGALAGIYRDIGKNLKVGVGYNFGRFSDDITDLSLNDGGLFVNVVGKF